MISGRVHFVMAPYPIEFSFINLAFCFWHSFAWSNLRGVHQSVNPVIAVQLSGNRKVARANYRKDNHSPINLTFFKIFLMMMPYN